MDEYVKKSELIKGFEHIKSSFGGPYPAYETMMFFDIENLIDNFPASPDVLKVVRCHDCEHWKEYDGKDGDKGLGWCENGAGDTTHALFYCASGRRRQDDD